MYITHSYAGHRHQNSQKKRPPKAALVYAYHFNKKIKLLLKKRKLLHRSNIQDCISDMHLRHAFVLFSV
jgi:hypothetical protein